MQVLRTLTILAVAVLGVAGCAQSALPDPTGDGNGDGTVGVDGGGNGPKVCEPECSSWRECVDGTCRLADNRCERTADCESGVCNTQTHTCVAAYCEPACAEWESCNGSTCALAAGRCLSNTDCTANTPLCNVGTHRCEAPPVDPVLAPTRWPGLIVTRESLRAPFEKLALVHTLTGIPTKVVTVEELCAGGCSDFDETKDAAKAIKDHLESQVASGLELVVLGGDLQEVPSRYVYDGYSNAIYGVTFEDWFYTDYYYSDLSEWDANGDGWYADDTTDEPDYRPELGVTRIPVSNVAEATRYVERAIAHLTRYELSSIQKALFTSNVATTVIIPVLDYPYEVDSGHYFAMTNRTFDIMPPGWTLKKLFGDPATADVLHGEVIANDLSNLKTQLQAGPNLVVHSGHGDVDGLMTEVDGSRMLTGAMAGALNNAHLPMLLSCACLAGTFAASDAAGERYINAPSGGGIAYLGNSAVGLGIAGGMQLIDEFLRYTFADHSAEQPARPLMGRALKAGHERLKETDGFLASELLESLMPSWMPDFQIPTVDKDSYEWTQKTVTFFGDGLLPIYTDPATRAAPTVSVQREQVGAFSRLVFTVTPATAGTLTVRTGSELRAVTLAAGATSATVTLPGAPAKVEYGFASNASLSAVGEKSF